MARTTGLLAIAVVLALCCALDRIDGRLVRPAALALAAYRLRTASDLEVTLQAKIQSYYDASGFPRAGRTMTQKMQEAGAFLAREFQASGAVGISAAVAYKDKVALSKGYGLRQAEVSSSFVTQHTMFQLGSVTKLMVAVGIAILVDEGKLAWHDPVKQHLPWLKLFDQYAEQHATIGDLLSMNSGFGRAPDVADNNGAFATERAFVESLQFCEPEHSLRETYDYANVNFVVLGQVVENVSGSPWNQFLQERLWTPLGMNNTFASPALVPRNEQELSHGHFTCEGETLGPYDLQTSRLVDVTPGRINALDASGSVVSCAEDMAKFMRMILNKGTVDGVVVLKSSQLISEMTTGKVALSSAYTAHLDVMGLHFSDTGGSTAAAGYGIDIVGQSIWGHAFFAKGGAMIVHHVRTGFAPSEHLGVIVMSNSMVTDAPLFLDHFRSYVMGIFLDVPTAILDAEWTRWRATQAKLIAPPLPGAPRCGLSFWKHPPTVPWLSDEMKALVGTYSATVSSKFYPHITITRLGTGKLGFAYGEQVGELKRLAALNAAMDANDTMTVLLDISVGLQSARLTRTLDGKGYTLHLDETVSFRQ